MKLSLTEIRKIDNGRVSSEDGRHQILILGCLAGFALRYLIGDDKRAVGYMKLELKELVHARDINWEWSL